MMDKKQNMSQEHDSVTQRAKAILGCPLSTVVSCGPKMSEITLFCYSAKPHSSVKE